MSKQSESVEELVWLSAAGDVNAQYALGMALIEGNGVDQNGEKGLEWLKAAAAGGNQSAVKALKRLGD